MKTRLVAPTNCRIPIVFIIIHAIIAAFGGSALAQGDRTGLDSLTWRAEKQGIVFEARSIKPVTIPYEPVHLRLKVTNASESIVEVAPLFLDYGGYLDYKLMDNTGETICYMSLTGSGGADYLKQISPGNERVNFTDISTIFCWPKGAVWPKLSPGNYNIELTLKAYIIRGAEKVIVRIHLGPIPFGIVPARGRDSVALALYEQGLALYCNKVFDGKEEKYFTQLMEDYYDTPYDLLAAKRLLSARKGNHPLLTKKRHLELRKKVLLRYPRNPFNSHNITNMAGMCSRAEMTELYNKIKNRENAAYALKLIEDKCPWVLEENQK